MRVCDCEHPRLIYNKYTHKQVLVNCGECDACKRHRQQKWVAAMIQESKCWQFTYSLNLDYNEKFLPKLDFSSNGDYLVQKQPRLLVPSNDDYNFIRIDELKFNASCDYEYFTERLNSHHTCIPVASVRDIQLFKKRLNTYICRRITGKNANFRSVIVSEFGPNTFRPHYHGILWFNDSKIAESLQGLVCDSWQDGCGHSLGHAFVEPDRGHFSKYLSKYIARPTDLPSFYSHPKIRPFCLSSRKPPIGCLLESNSEIQGLFNNSSCTRVVFEKNNRDGFVARSVPITKRLQAQLFPKCPLFSEITDYERTLLYKSAIGNRGIISDFGEFLTKLVVRCTDGLVDLVGFKSDNPLLEYDVDKFKFYLSNGKLDFRNTTFARLVCRLSQDFTSVHSLVALHHCCCRVWFQSEIFGVSVDSYLSHIYKHYEKYELFKLRQFYQMQSSTLDDYPSTDIRSFYPLTYFDECNPVDEKVSQDFLQTQRFLQKEETKTHKFNAYLESLKVKDSVLYNLTTNYYAQKCNENVKAESQSRS